MTLTIGLWQIEIYHRAIHATRQPDPKCRLCDGTGGGWEPTHFGPDWDPCRCIDAIRHHRIPLWPRSRRQYLESEPF